MRALDMHIKTFRVLLLDFQSVSEFPSENLIISLKMSYTAFRTLNRTLQKSLIVHPLSSDTLPYNSNTLQSSSSRNSRHTRLEKFLLSKSQSDSLVELLYSILNTELHT